MRHPRRRGQALVEFALILPVLLVILLGTVDAGRLIFAYNAVANAAREGGRTAIINQTPAEVRQRAAEQATVLGMPTADPGGCPPAGGPTTQPTGVCFVLRSQQFRLALLPSTIPAAIYAVDGTGQSSRGKGVQFGIRDVLIWTTSLALILAAARSRDWYMLSQGLLSAMVIVAALWAALGEGPAWLRWPLLVVFTFSAGLAQSVVDWSYLRMWPAKPGFWSLEHWDYLWLNQWWLLVAACFAGSLLAAALLIYRVLGYRLCRVVKQANQDDSMRSTA